VIEGSADVYSLRLCLAAAGRNHLPTERVLLERQHSIRDGSFLLVWDI